MAATMPGRIWLLSTSRKPTLRSGGFINQQFLIHEFADTSLVNREDDLGLEGLRKAKLSYNPIGYARKYQVIQRQAGVV